jgi:hypothetical protein
MQFPMNGTPELRGPMHPSSQTFSQSSKLQHMHKGMLQRAWKNFVSVQVEIMRISL